MNHAAIAMVILGAAGTLAVFGVAALAGRAALPEERRCLPDMASAMQEIRGIHGEQIAGVGRTSDGRRIVLTAGANDRWTLLIDDGGRVCLLAEGGGWKWSLIARGRNL